MRPTSFVFVTLSTTLAAVACGTTNSISELEESVQTEAPAVSHDGKRVCQGAFFDAHPVVGTATDSKGFALPIPLAACDSEFAVVIGTVDRTALAQRLAGTGYEPVKLSGNRAVARMYVTQFKKSDVGAYNEFAVGYDAVPTGSPNFEVPWVNPYTSLVPAFTPGTTVFIDRLVLQRGTGDLAIRDGRELAGLDKRPGAVAIGNHEGNTVFAVSDEKLKPVAWGALSLDLSPASQLAEANQLAQAFGLPDASYLPPPAPELVVPLVNKDIRTSGDLYSWSGVFGRPNAAMGAMGSNDSLKLGRGELGNILSGMGYTPQVILRYFDADVVYPPRGEQ